MVKIKSILLDFLNYAFLLAIIGFFIFYIIVGDRFKIISSIMEALTPVSIILIIFLLKTKSARNDLEKFKSENNLDEIIIYFNTKDIIRDYIVIGLLPLIFFFTSIIDASIDIYDLLQILLGTTLMFIAHYFLFFPKDTIPVTRNSTRLNKTIDEILIYFLPVLILGVCAVKMSVNLVDLIQALLAFMLFFFWRKFLFKHAN